MRRWRRVVRVLASASVILAVSAAQKQGKGGGGASSCRWNSSQGNIKHVIYLIFDNVHFRRDNPNVPSDLEQMPNLLNFIRDNGTLHTNHHTVLISHTANGILTDLTGVYSDRHGQSVANSYRYFKSDGSTASSSSFKYWTDIVDDTSGDMTKVFGVGSAEWNEAVMSNAAPAGSAARNLAQTDFVGFAIHCAKGGGICTGNQNARPDSLPDEAGGYSGFLGLFGAKYVNPAITNGSPAVNNLDGHPIGDQFGQVGFPGFDGLFATTTLAYIAQMQEAGIPVTFGYISDAHDQHGVAGEIHATRGPGEADYVQQLKNYDNAFGQFFTRLAAAGIDKSNTLFVFTVEEGDHFVGSPPTDPTCDGVTTPCTYSLIGEVNGNLTGLLATQQNITTPFTVHSDMAPTIYLTGNLSPTNSTTRAFGRALSKLTAVNPYTHVTDTLAAALADPAEMNLLHMVTADPQRTPTLTMFAKADYFLFTGAPNCNAPCITVPTTPPTSTFAWNHGGIQPEIATIWLGIVGPGMANDGQDDITWSDHPDVRPTMLTLLGLQDTYIHDGRVLTEHMATNVQPVPLRGHTKTLGDFVAVYKQINAPFGQLGMDSLAVSTAAIASGDAHDDATYTTLTNKIIGWTATRNSVAGQMRAILFGAAFNGQKFDENLGKQLIAQGQALLSEAHTCAANIPQCAR